MGERIAVAMSGGVDSSVAAWLLQREGHELMGVTLRLFDRETPEGTCGASDDLADARAVAERLGMPHQVLDCRTCFRERVIRPFAAAYEAGCTPNPCVDCNRGIKFGSCSAGPWSWGRRRWPPATMCAWSGTAPLAAVC